MLTVMIVAIGSVFIGAVALHYNATTAMQPRGRGLFGQRKAYAVAASACIFVFGVVFVAMMAWLAWWQPGGG